MHRLLPLTLLVFVFSLWAASLPAQAPVPALSSDQPLSVDEIEKRIEALQSQDDLEEAARKSTIDLYRSAISYAKSAAQYQGRTISIQETIDAAPSEIAALSAQRERRSEGEASGETEELPSDASLSDLEGALLQAQVAVTSATNDLQRLDKQIQLERGRPLQIRERLGELQSRRTEFENKIQPIDPVDIGVVEEARHQRDRAHLAAVRSELESLEKELLSHDVMSRLLSARQSRARRQLALSQTGLKQLELLVIEVKRADAVQARVDATKVRIESVGKFPLISESAEFNAQLSSELARIAVDRTELSEQLSETNRRIEQIAHDFRSTRQRIEIAGVSAALGRALLDVRGQLPDLQRYQQEVAKRQPVLRRIGLAQLRISEQRRNLTTFQRRLRLAFAQRQGATLSVEEIERLYPYFQKLRDTEDLQQLIAVFREMSEAQRDHLHRELSKLQSDQLALLNRLDTAYSEKIRALSDLDFAQRQLVEDASEFVQFIDQHLLWTPSTTPINLDTLRDTPAAFGYLLDPEKWRGVGTTLVGEIRAVPGRAVLATVIVLLLVVSRSRLKRKLLELGQINRYPYARGYGVTLQALLVTFLMTVIWPLILGFIGRRLEVAVDAPQFVNAVGTALVNVAWFLLIFTGFSVMCRKGGVAVEQFKWSPSIVDLVRRNLRWLLPVVVPNLLIISTLSQLPERAHIDSLGRFAYILVVVAMGVFLHRMFSSRTGIPAISKSQGATDWWVRLHVIWYWPLVLVPFAGAVMAAVGFFYSTVIVIKVVYYTVWLFVGAKILADLVERWLIVTQRRLEWQRLLKAHEERASAEDTDETDSAGEGGLAIPHEEGLDFQTINEQTRRLLNAVVAVSLAIGLVTIWATVFPTLSILDDLVLWQSTTTVDGASATRLVTVADVLLVIVTAIVVMIAARNVPGLLEIAILQRLPLDAGLRYAISSLCQYAIVTVGLIAIFHNIGIGWGDVQWLAAALTVGLGFGLQEIFANFVSGLIILFERPIRIGDTVTIQGITGTVSRIRTRATTITDWDNKEIVVPNKTFITSELTNWTLSDPVVRVVMQVGVAYGADTTLAHRVMLETAKSNPMVLENPAPTVYFLGLGDSSLDFDVRVYVKDMGDWLPVAHEFHMNIVKALTENGVQIPYPQRDLHIRSVSPLTAGTADVVSTVTHAQPQQS